MTGVTDAGPHGAVKVSTRPMWSGTDRRLVHGATSLAAASSKWMMSRNFDAQKLS